MEALFERFRKFQEEVFPAREDLCAERAARTQTPNAVENCYERRPPMSNTRPPLPPFDFETAVQKVRQAEDAWNTRDPERVALAYTEDSRWRNWAEFFRGSRAIVEFLKRKWARELDYRLIKELWHFTKIASPFAFNTNGTTIPATGSAHTATSSGNSMRMA
jgi:Protein of unknown function (DUF1348)